MRVAMADHSLIPVVGIHEVYGVREGLRLSPRLDLKLLGRETSHE